MASEVTVTATTPTDGAAATPEEEKAIRSLHRLAAKWPKTLWLFAASGTLCVMQKDADGYKRMVEDGMDPAAVLETIKIECDGGDW